MRNYRNSSGNARRRKVRIQRPSHQSAEDDQLWLEAQRYLKMMPSTPEPNMGRVEEIKEEIRKGTYPDLEVLEETAARLAIRFMRRE